MRIHFRDSEVRCEGTEISFERQRSFKVKEVEIWGGAESFSISTSSAEDAAGSPEAQRTVQRLQCHVLSAFRCVACPQTTSLEAESPPAMICSKDVCLDE